MNAAPVACFALMAILLAGGGAGCRRQAPAPAAQGPRASALADGGEIRWRGMGACADCDGIDAQLTLRRAGARNEFDLVETYYSGRRGVRFADHGRWQQAGGLVRLHGDGGSTRVYALLPDGRLQARGTHGALPRSDDDDVLVPVLASDNPQAMDQNR